jgi:hypothetical protein
VIKAKYHDEMLKVITATVLEAVVLVLLIMERWEENHFNNVPS